MTAITASRLAGALKAKFPGGAKDALCALGINSDILAPETPASGNEEMKSLRVDLERLIESMTDLPENAIGKLLQFLDARIPFDKIDDDHPQAARARELAGDDEKYADVRAFLKRQGFSAEDIEKAIGLVEGRGRNTMPLNATRGGSGGELAGDCLALDKMFPELARIDFEGTQHARPRYRSANADANSFAAMYPDAMHIGMGPR